MTAVSISISGNAGLDKIHSSQQGSAIKAQITHHPSYFQSQNLVLARIFWTRANFHPYTICANQQWPGVLEAFRAAEDNKHDVLIFA